MAHGAAGANPEADGGVTTVAAATPLEQIRKKESELSGRVLGAKREADEIVADARRQAASIIAVATEASTSASRESQRAATEAAEVAAKSLLEEAESEAGGLAASIEPRVEAAVDFVVKSVVGD